MLLELKTTLNKLTVNNYTLIHKLKNNTLARRGFSGLVPKKLRLSHAWERKGIKT